MDLARVNPVAVLVAAALMFVIGGIWYSGLAFERPWRRLVGLTEDQLRAANPARTFGLSFVAALVAAVNLAFFLAAPNVDVAFGALAGLLAGLGWVAMAMGITYLFEQRPLRLWLIDAGYHVLAFTAMGALLGAWR
jgi:Protein of unknown function (DUF1761)